MAAPRDRNKYKRFLEEENLEIPLRTKSRRGLVREVDSDSEPEAENVHDDGEEIILDPVPAQAAADPDRARRPAWAHDAMHMDMQLESEPSDQEENVLDEQPEDVFHAEWFDDDRSSEDNGDRDHNQDFLDDEDVHNFAQEDTYEEDPEEDHEKNGHKLRVTNGDQPVSSEGSDMKKLDSLLAVLSYAVKHHISGVALQDLIDLINLHCPNTLPSSKYLFGNSLAGYKGVCEFHFYCTCNTYLGNIDSLPNTCSNCDKAFSKDESLKKGNFFLVLPLSHQLQHLMESKGLGEVLTNRDRSIDEEYIRDIQDGLLYRKLVDDGLLSDNNNFSMTWNTDGVPIFHSSKCSIWPVLCSINELPMKMRRENVILTALWFGEGKPDMNVFLKPFVNECNKLSSTGFKWKLNKEEKLSRVFPLVCTVDTVARPLLQKMMQFNGFYGCGFCKHKGEYISNCVKYPHVDPPPAPRDNFQTKEESIIADETGRSINGVKGVSILSFLTYFNIITSFVPDYMHAVCLGSVKRFVSMWLNPSNRKKEWYIGHLSKELCERLKFIQATKEMTRLPRSLKELKFWKANEWRSFLFYSPTILKGILPTKYLAHWSMLCCSIFHLNSQKISKQTLNLCDFLLHKFVLYVEPLYGKEETTFNIHLLMHMCDSVRNWGPLWGTSAFMFESYNGYMKKLYAGTRYLPQQIVQSICRMQDIIRYAPSISSQLTADYVSTMISGHHFIKNAQRVVSGGSTLVCLGRSKVLFVTHLYRTAIENFLGQNLVLDTVTCFDRFILNNVLLSSRNYSSKFRRNNSIIDVEGMLAEIVSLISFINHVCTDNNCHCQNHVLLLLQQLNVVKTFKSQFDQELVCTVDFIRAVDRGSYVVLNGNVSFKKAMLVNVGETEYVINLPNAVEGD